MEEISWAHSPLPMDFGLPPCIQWNFIRCVIMTRYSRSPTPKCLTHCQPCIEMVQGDKCGWGQTLFRADVTSTAALNREFVPDHNCHPVHFYAPFFDWSINYFLKLECDLCVFWWRHGWHNFGCWSNPWGNKPWFHSPSTRGPGLFNSSRH